MQSQLLRIELHANSSGVASPVDEQQHRDGHDREEIIQQLGADQAKEYPGRQDQNHIRVDI